MYKPMSDSFDSCYGLMQANKQEEIFKRLIAMLDEYFNIELKMIETAKTNGSLTKYIDVFGNETMIGHILHGVKQSMDYTGKFNHSTVYDDLIRLTQRISEAL